MEAMRASEADAGDGTVGSTRLDEGVVSEASSRFRRAFREKSLLRLEARRVSRRVERPARRVTPTRARGTRLLLGASAVARSGCVRSRRGLSRVVPPFLDA